jgi:Raf kinase inhibitor-like YbhB/YbcL family protein
MLEKLPSSLGRALRGIRADEIELTFNDAALSDVPAAIEVTSSEFSPQEFLPPRFTADGEGVSPPLTWRGVPPGTASLVLLVEDADSPTPQPLVHAIVWGLPGQDGGIPEGALPRASGDPALAPMGRNSYLSTTWLPPDPPSGHGPHRYAFQVFALDVLPRFDSTPGRAKVLDCLREHATSKGLLFGTYERR